MSRITKKYSQEFRSEAIKLALSSESVSRAAQDLGIPSGTLHTWVNQAKSRHGAGDVSGVGDLLTENKNLKRRLSRLEQEKAILKKAAAYFAKELG